MGSLLSALMGRVAEYTPEQLESLGSLLEHSQHNINTDQLVPMPGGKTATSYTAGFNVDGKEMLIPTAWDGEIAEPELAMQKALSKRQDWPVFDDVNRATRAADLAHQLMMYQKKETTE